MCLCSDNEKIQNPFWVEVWHFRTSLLTFLLELFALWKCLRTIIVWYDSRSSPPAADVDANSNRCERDDKRQRNHFQFLLAASSFHPRAFHYCQTEQDASNGASTLRNHTETSVNVKICSPGSVANFKGPKQKDCYQFEKPSKLHPTGEWYLALARSHHKQGLVLFPVEDDCWETGTDERVNTWNINCNKIILQVAVKSNSYYTHHIHPPTHSISDGLIIGSSS